MNPLIPQREHFAGPERLSPAWSLHKGPKTATCEVWSHQFGFELRVSIGAELVDSRVCRSQEDLIASYEQLRTAFEERGWTAPV